MKKRIRHVIDQSRNRRRGRARWDLGLESLEDRMLLANPQLVAIVANSGEVLQPGRQSDTAPNELLLRFDENQSLDPTSLHGIQIQRSGGDDLFGNGNDVTITPGYIAVGDERNEVIVRFKESLPDDLYQIHITGPDGLQNVAEEPFDNDPNQPGFQDLLFEFRLDLGAQVTAVVPQPVKRNPNGMLSQSRNQIVVYFNDDDLDPALAEDPKFYQLIETNETATNQDNPTPITPVRVDYNANRDQAILSFGQDLAALTSGTGTFRLRIGNSEPIPSPPLRTEVVGDVGSTYDTAYNVGVLADRARILESDIEPQPWLVTFPGSNEDLGSRDIPYRGEQHVELAPDGRNGVTTIAYNFRDELGTDEDGNPFFNFITEDQKQRAREAFELWSTYAGLQFIESETSGITIGIGDLRAIVPRETGGRGDGTYFATLLDPRFEEGIVILDIAEQWDDAFGDNTNPFGASWFRYVMAGIGHVIGLGSANNLPAPTIQSTVPPPDFANSPAPEIVFPGPHDIAHIQHIHRPDSNDVDFYRFEIAAPGVVTLETNAQRLTEASLLDTALLLFQEDMEGARQLIARNDDYFSEDSFIQLDLEPGTYYVGISSSGNTNYDPDYENSGGGGTTQGDYELRLNFSPQIDNVLRDATGTAFDGDADGSPNGIYSFWFRTAPSENTLFVDKLAAAGGDGSAAAPFRTIPAAFAAAGPGDIVRVVGNGGSDNDVATVEDNKPYLIGFDLIGQPLPDGESLKVPRGITVMVDAGAVFKLHESSIQVGSTSPEVNRSKSALQILGTPDQQVFFTSYNDEDIGEDTNMSLVTSPMPGDWGGIKLRNDIDSATGRFDYEQEGIFLNYIAHADMRYGGGMVVIDSVQQIVTPIDMTNSRPTVVFSEISRSADAAMSANPDSFAETTFNATEFQDVPFTSDYVRIGPDLNGNTLVDNTTNGLFVRIQTPAGQQQQQLTVAGRWDDTDVTHVVAENLIIRGQPGGPIGTQIDGNTNIPVVDRFILTSRLDASLVIDPGIVVKIDGARIETGIGAQLIAEGTSSHNIIFTSIEDDRYGAGGTFDTRSNGSSAQPQPGDWSGLYFGHASSGSVDHAFLAHGGGITKIEGSFTGFNAVEIHQAEVRITNSVFDDNADGVGGQATANRFGRGANAPGVIFVLGAQPVIVDNLFRNTVGDSGSFGAPVIAPAISVDVNSLDHTLVQDWGRSTGTIGQIKEFQNNQGALIRRNDFVNNSTNGMVVRGGTLTTQSVWDDTDIVHVVLDQIIVPDFDTYGGLRLESAATESLVVKFFNADAGLTATGRPLDIVDRIGGSIQIIGQPNNPVILTSLADDSAGAGFVSDTDNRLAFPAPGDWRGVTIEQYANDRNVAVYVERESPTSISQGSNDNPTTAERLGNLAPHENAGDDNRRLGFEVHGYLNRSADADVYSFEADAGTLVWIDIDRTSAGLDTVVELVASTGEILARSDNSAAETATWLGPVDERLGDLSGIGRLLDVEDTRPGDLYTINEFDAGMRVELPGSRGQLGTYHVRVRSSSGDLTNLGGGESKGAYQLQLRLREIDEIPGSSVVYADISYATNGISVLGQPNNSPLLGEYAETTAINDDITTAQDLGNFLVSDQGAVSVSGFLGSANDVDWYQIELQYESVDRQSPDEAVSVIFDIDYADGLGRPDTMLSIFSPNGELVLTSNNAGVSDDLAKPAGGSDTADTSRGSVGDRDPLLGPVQLLPGTYFLAISGGTMPAVFDQFDQRAAVDTLARFEPLDSVGRIGEDHADLFLGGLASGQRNISTAEEPQIPIIFGDEFAVVVPGDVSIREGETITVESLAGQKASFEFDTEGFLLLPPEPGDLVDGETVAIRSAPRFFGDLGALATFQLTSQGYIINVTNANRIADGDSFFVEAPDGTFFGFEFDNNFITSPFSDPIFFTAGQTVEEIAASIAAAVNDTLVLTAVADGSQVELENANNVLTFGGGGGFVIIEPTSGDDILVSYDENQTQEEFANNLADAINRSGIATATVEGIHSFRIRLENVLDVRLSRGGGMAANQPIRGGNVPIAYTPFDDALTIGTAISNAINNAMGGFGIFAGIAQTTLNGSAEISLTDSSLGTGVIIGGTFFASPAPIVGLSPGSDLSIIRPGVVPYTLQDVTLYVVEAGGLTNSTRNTLLTVDAYSGAVETTVGPFGGAPVGDVDLRPTDRGTLYAITYTNGNGDRNDGATGTTYQLSNTNAAEASVGDDGVETFIEDPANPGQAIKPGQNNAGVGINYQAMTFDSDDFFLAVGSRNDAGGPLNGNSYRSNLVYRIDARSGAAESRGNARTGNPVPQYEGAGTQIVERGYIDTINDVGGTIGTIIATADATGIRDGMLIDFTDGGQATTFEFESGPEIQLTANPSLGQTVRDGDRFIIDGTRFTFDTGAVLVVESNGAGFTDGDTIAIVDDLGTLQTFEFDSDGEVSEGALAIPFTPLNGQGQMINAIVAAINNASSFRVQAVATGNRITLTNDAVVTATSTGVRTSGSQGVAAGVRLVVEETFTNGQIGEVVVNAFKSIAAVTASHAGDRVNFLGAQTADFSGVSIFVDSGAQPGVGTNREPISFLVSDTAEIIAARIMNAVNQTTGAIASQLTDDTVSLITPGATFTSVENPLVLGGTPPGGIVTGIAPMPFTFGGPLAGNRYLAVTSTGGLFEYNDTTGTSRYVATSTDLLGIQFAGLTIGPQDIENGRYAGTYFGIDNSGTMHAFDELGQLVPVFANGASSVSTGVFQPVGLAFGLHQENLWSKTELHRGDPGHGVEIPVTDSRLAEASADNTSLHFGVSVDDLNDRNYDFPGGAQGTLISNTFSLADYSASDQPVLYFNYLLNTEDAVYAPNANPPQPMRDSFRVYIMDDREDGDRGEWYLLATNNQYLNDSDYDEFDDMDLNDGIHIDVQELYDNADWRQARVDLSEFAGRENLRLRFEFASAGGVSLGNDGFFGFGGGTTVGGFFQSVGFGGQEGTELYAVPADKIRDGHEFTLDFYRSTFFDPGGTFEFDLGFTLVPPSGDRLPDGETFTLMGSDGAVVTYEFDKDGTVGVGNVPVIVLDTMSASDVAVSIETALAGSDLGRPSVGTGNFTGNMSIEANDNLRLAVDSGLAPGSTGVFTAVGQIGDNLATTSFNDVDVIKFELNTGDGVQIRLPSSDTSLALRLFNEDGVEQTNTGFFFGGATTSIDFTAPGQGTYFVGISSTSNTNYDPFQTQPGGGANTGVIGNYEVEITTGGGRLTTYRTGNRLNMQGLADVVQAADASLFVDGRPGTQNPSSTPIKINGGMNEIEVASAIEQALADGFSGGDTSWVLRRDEMIKIAGRTVIEPGPLGMSDHLWGDFTSAFNFSWSERFYADGPFKGLNNDPEGAYVDDIVIGFAERGEMVVDAAPDTSFIPRTDISDRTIVTGPYQLEIREASQYGVPDILHPNLDLLRTFDTNERLSAAVNLETPEGADLSSGQTFTISDGQGEVRFEYKDRTVAEDNDTLATAEPSNLVGGLSGTYVGIGQIGDNRAFGGDNNNLDLGTDVDIIELNLQQDDLVVVDVDAFNPDDLVTRASALDSLLRIFDASGRQIAISDDDLGPGDLDVRPAFFDPAVTFRAPATGKYYVAVSQSQNSFYDPTVAGSGSAPLHIDIPRDPAFRNSVIVVEEEPLDLSGGTYEITIELNGGAPESDDVVIPFASFDDANAVANRIARAINSAEVQSRVTFTAAPRERSGVIDLHGENIVVTNLTTSLSPEANDTLADATLSNAVVGRSSRFQVAGQIGDNQNLVANPGLDVDIFRIDLEAGGILTVDVDAFEIGSALLAAATVIDSSGNPLASAGTTFDVVLDPTAFRTWDPLTPEDRRLTGIDPILEFRAPTTGTYYVAISNDSNLQVDLFGNAIASFDPLVEGSGTLANPFNLTGRYEALIQVGDGGTKVERNDLYGDSNIARGQGQLILESNRILSSAEFGIRVDAGTRDGADNLPHPGPVRNLPDINVSRLVPGVTITNNIVARSGTGGILFSGDPGGMNLQPGAVPFGRIINNTLYGGGSIGAGGTTGILVTEDASPTLLNNIVAEFDVGVNVDASSNTTVVGATLYHNNGTNALTPAGLGDFPITLSSFRRLFEDPSRNNFYLVSGSEAIDSSVDSLADRIDLVNVRDSLGITVSPILAPDLDNAGQLRVDDPNVRTPVGQGENVFKDRGALDRSDFTGPRAVLVNPPDNDPAGADTDPTEGRVKVPSASLESFIVDLVDSTGNGGIGVDDDSVSASAVEVSQNGVLLTEGVDYVFEYARTNNQFRLSPINGVWPLNSTFEVSLNNAVVTDLAGNPLRPNRLDGSTVFVISTDLGRDFGDAPAPYPSTLNEDGAQHQIIDGFYLGMGVTDELDSAADDSDEMDDGVVFGSSFIANLTAEITVNVSAPGFIDAWVDWNGDGDWIDAGEKILTKRSVATGANLFVVRAPDGIPDEGTTFARFRLSSAGVSAPTGLAADGEVEDYEVALDTNPWQNPDNPVDVDGMNGPTPLDALAIIQELSDFTYASSRTGRLPIPAPSPDSPPPFLDVNGDGFVSPLDALLVISALPSNQMAAPMAAPLAARAEISDQHHEILVSHLMAVDLESVGLESALRTTDAIWGNRDQDFLNLDDGQQAGLSTAEAEDMSAARPVRRLADPTKTVTNDISTDDKISSEDKWEELVEHLFGGLARST